MVCRCAEVIVDAVWCADVTVNATHSPFHTHRHPDSLSLCLYYSLSLSLSHTHTYTHTCALSFSFPHSLTSPHFSPHNLSRHFLEANSLVSDINLSNQSNTFHSTSYPLNIFLKSLLCTAEGGGRMDDLYQVSTLYNIISST